MKTESQTAKSQASVPRRMYLPAVDKPTSSFFFGQVEDYFGYVTAKKYVFSILKKQLLWIRVSEKILEMIVKTKSLAAKAQKKLGDG